MSLKPKLCFEQQDMELITNWMRVNKLSLNVKKSKSMLFTRRRNELDAKIEIRVGEAVFEQVECFKYLGLYLDPKLNFSHHIEWTCAKAKFKLSMSVFALGLRQFALSEKKSNLANYSAIQFRQIWAAGEIHYLVVRKRNNSSDYYVFGITGKLFKSVIQWCLFHVCILKTL